MKYSLTTNKSLGQLTNIEYKHFYLKEPITRLFVLNQGKKLNFIMLERLTWEKILHKRSKLKI